MEKELLLSVHDLKKSFGEREILKGISFDVRRGDVVCIIGPSGSGKSTLLHMMGKFHLSGWKFYRKLHFRHTNRIAALYPNIKNSRTFIL